MHQSLHVAESTFQTASLILSADEVQLWRVDLDAVADAESRWQPFLSADELGRAGRFRFARDRQRFTAVRALLRMVLGSYLGSDSKELAFRYSKQGKPALSMPQGDNTIAF